MAALACVVAAGSSAAERLSSSEGAYTLRAMPLRHASQDPAARAPLEALWGHVIGQLRQVPGITLIGATDAIPAGDGRQVYDLILASLPVTRQANGNESYTSLYDTNRRGSYTAASQRTGRAWPVEMRLEHEGRDPTRSNMNAIAFLYKEGVPRSPVCQSAVRPETIMGGSDCWTTPELAERLVDSLRLEKLPPDDGMYRKLVAQIADVSLPERQRLRALSSLMSARRDGRFPVMDETGTQAISDFAAGSTGDSQGQIWGMVQGASLPQFIPAMVQTMQSNPSEWARLETFDTLASDFADVPDVRASFQKTAREDSRELLRMLATRALGDEAAWNAYVISNLRNGQLTAQQRTEPLLHIEGRAQEAQLRGLINTRAFTEALLGAARDNQAAPTVGERGVLRRSLNMLVRYGDPQLLIAQRDWVVLEDVFNVGDLPARFALPAGTAMPSVPPPPPAR